MTFDKIIMNPPYDNGLGGKITFEVISLLRDDGNCICLMPLSNYKNKSAELWRKVKTFELANPKLFVDADITKNLCICTLENRNVDKYSWEDMQFESFDKRYIEFYKRNKELTMKYRMKEIRFKRCDNAKVEDFNTDLDVLDTNRLPDESVGYMFGGAGFGYKWNILKDYSKVSSGASCVHMPSKKAKDNYTIWLYKKNRIGTLADKLIWGTNKITVSSTCSIAIPQIDWETISDNPLWKEGKYDEAVLDVMGLMWDEEKSNIVRKK